MVFHKENRDVGPAAVLGLEPLPEGAPISGLQCRGARTLLDQSQQELREAAGVSKKSINDFENGLVVLRPRLTLALRAELEKAGASFVQGPEATGVIARVPLRPSTRSKPKAAKAGKESKA